VKRQLARVRTGTVVEVVAVYPGNGADQPTTIDVKPMVDQIDSGDERTPHDVVYGIHVHRIHGGGNAVLIDPVVGDVGFMVAADRDFSEVAKNKGQASAPGSGRQHDMSDSVYHGGIWTPTPTNFIDLRGGNVGVSTQGQVTIGAGSSVSVTSGTPMTFTGGGNFV
jgi:hypothetical protein